MTCAAATLLGPYNAGEVMRFVKANLSHKDKSVRDAMVKLATAVYLVIGSKRMATLIKDIK